MAMHVGSLRQSTILEIDCSNIHANTTLKRGCHGPHHSRITSQASGFGYNRGAFCVVPDFLLWRCKSRPWSVAPMAKSTWCSGLSVPGLNYTLKMPEALTRCC